MSLLAPLCASTQFTLEDSLQLYYPFNGNTQDESGNGRHGIPKNNPTLTTDHCGNSNSAYAFDGINDWIATYKSFDYEYRTVSAWFLKTSGSDQCVLAQDANSLNYGAFVIYVNPSEQLVVTAGGHGSGQSTISSNLQPGVWNHTALVRTEDTNYHYLNGYLVATSISNSLSSSAYPNPNLVIGTNRDSADRWWNGKIDEVRVYNRALSYCEIRQLYCPAAPCLSPRDTTIVAGTTLTIFNDGGPNDTIDWYVNGVLTSQHTDSFIETFNDTGMFVVVAVAGNECCSLSDTIYVHVTPKGSCLKVSFLSKISSISGGLTASLGDVDHFGNSITPMGDLNGDGVPDIAVAAYLADDGSNDNGAFYILMLNADGTVQSHQKISELSGGLGSIGTSVRFGHGIANIGDVNGDGNADLAVGAAFDNDGGANRGAVWILFLDNNQQVMAKQKISDTEGGLSEALSNGDNFGTEVCGIGDLNGDGVPDLLVGCYNDAVSGSQTGSAFVLLLNANGTVANEAKIANGTFPYIFQNQDRFGAGLTHLGDFDNDGYTEVVIGSLYYDATGANSNEGAVFIVTLDNIGNAMDAVLITEGQGGFTGDLNGNTSFSLTIANAGDLDGDGYLEFLVSNHTENDGGPQKGAFWLLSIDSTGQVFYTKKFSQTHDNLGISLDNEDLFGLGLSIIGDLNGDGVPDLAVSAARDDDGGTDRGAVYLFTITDTCCNITAAFSTKEAYCFGDTVRCALFQPNNNPTGAAYTWLVNGVVTATGTTAYQFVPTESDTFTITLVAAHNDCRDTQSVTVVADTIIAITAPVVSVCTGAVVQFNVAGGTAYQWNNATTLSNDTIPNPIASPMGNTVYTVTIDRAATCDSAVTYPVVIIPSKRVFLDTTLCNALTSPSGNHLWNVSGIYFDTLASTQGCDSIIRVVLEILPEDDSLCATDTTTKPVIDCTIIYPNILTPNGDGINDNLTIDDLCGKNPAERMEVYNRWGILVWSGHGVIRTWDGTINGTPAPDGVYFFIYHGKVETHMGSVTLIR